MRAMWSPEDKAKLKEKFLDALVEHGSILVAAQESGAGAHLFYKMRREDREFALAWDKRIECSVKILEDSMYERALKGDNFAAVAWLRAHAPAKYKDKLQVNTNIEQYNHLQQTINLNALSLDDKRQYRELLTKLIDQPTSRIDQAGQAPPP